MVRKEAIRLDRLTGEKVKELARRLAGKTAEADSETWTEAFAASGAKPGGKNPPPGATV